MFGFPSRIRASGLLLATVLAAAESSFRRAEQELVNRVELAFARALAEGRRVEIARAELALVEKLLSFEERRLEAGAGTQLDLNLARAAAGRVRQRLQEALAARAGARTALAEAVGVDPASPPTPVGSGPGPAPELEPLPELVERAVAARPDLMASREALEAAKRRVELQRSLAVPNLRAGRRRRHRHRRRPRRAPSRGQGGRRRGSARTLRHRGDGR